MNHVVMYSGGVGSWAAARRVVDNHGADSVRLLFTDTMTEDESTYTFMRDGAAVLGCELVEDSDGRDVWQVFRDVRFMGNTRADPCSRVLKRERARAWVEANTTPEDTLLHFGIDWTESHRMEAVARNWKPWRVSAPLLDKPWRTKRDYQSEARAAGLTLPELYERGFPHANCGGFCVKAGQAQFARLLAEYPERYEYHEGQERALRAELGDVSILRDRRDTGDGGAVKTLTMTEFRERIQAGGQLDLFDWGGCGCMVDSD